MIAAVGNLATHTYLGPTIDYVDKVYNFGNPAGSNTSYVGTPTIDMSDVIPSGKTIIGAAFTGCSTNRAGGLKITDVNTTSNIITCRIGYSYNENVTATVRAWYVDSDLASSIDIQYIDKSFTPGNLAGGNTSYNNTIENTFDPDIPTNSTVLFAGFSAFTGNGTRTGTCRIEGVENRTCKVSIRYSYNESVSYVLRLFYINKTIPSESEDNI